MREMGIRGLLIYCSDYKCSHNIAISADRWPDHVRLSDLEPLFTCTACGLKGAEVRANFNWEREQSNGSKKTAIGVGSVTAFDSAHVNPFLGSSRG